MAALKWIAVFVAMACVAIFVRLQCTATAVEPMTTAAAFSYLVTPDELATYKTQLLATAGERSARCARPVLRGQPLPGPALTDQLAFETDAPLSSCLAAWRNTLDELPATEPTARQVEVIGRCAAPLEAAVRAATGHAEGCSAHGLGGPEPSEQSTVLFVGQLLGRRARQLAISDPQAALWMLLDVIRLGQDHARGRTDLMLAMIGTAIASGAVEHAHAILDTTKPAKLDELAAALEVLLASEPSFGEVAASDTPRVAIDFALSGLEPDSWVPPGGKRKQHAQPIDASDPDRYGGAMQLMAFSRLAPLKIAHACPADASLGGCFNGFTRPAIPVPSDGTPRSLVQQALVEATMSQLVFTLRDYVVKRAQHHSDLIALRLHVEAMRHGCDRRALTELATTPALGDAVQVTYAADAFVVRPPAWATSAIPAEPLTRRIACPPTGTP